MPSFRCLAFPLIPNFSVHRALELTQKVDTGDDVVNNLITLID